MNDIHVAFNCDNAYLKYVAVTITSILANSKDNEYLHFHILHSGVDPENIEKINRLKNIKDFTLHLYEVDSSIFFTEKTNFSSCKNNESNYGLLLSELLSTNIEKVLKLDADIIVRSSVSEFYNIDIEDFHICAVLDNLSNPLENLFYKVLYLKEWDENIDLSKYFNAGVYVVNLKKWREDNCGRKVRQLLEEINPKTNFFDQDALNISFNNSVKLAGEEWNFQSWMQVVNVEPKIIHYTMNKPWIYPALPFGDIYWVYARKTDFYEEILSSVARPRSMWQSLKYHMKVAFNSFMLLFPFVNQTKYKASRERYRNTLKSEEWYLNEINR